MSSMSARMRSAFVALVAVVASMTAFVHSAAIGTDRSQLLEVIGLRLPSQRLDVDDDGSTSNVAVESLVNNVTANIRRRALELNGAGSDKSYDTSTVKICDCERLIQVYESLPEPPFEVLSTPVNCPHAWHRVFDPHQIPAVHYKVTCPASSDCCKTKVGDYNCTPISHRVMVLQRVDHQAKDSNGCCLYRPKLVDRVSSCACIQRVGGTYSPSLPEDQSPQ